MSIAIELKNAVELLNNYIPKGMLDVAKATLEVYYEWYKGLEDEEMETLMFQILNDNLNRIKDYLKSNGLDYNELMGKAVVKELYH